MPTARALLDACILEVMSVTDSSTAADRRKPADLRPSGAGLNVWGWLAVTLFATSALAIISMLVLKWVTDGGEVWPWFTRYAYIAFPGAFACLVLSLLQTMLQRRRS